MVYGWGNEVGGGAAFAVAAGTRWAAVDRRRNAGGPPMGRRSVARRPPAYRSSSSITFRTNSTLEVTLSF